MMYKLRKEKKGFSGNNYFGNSEILPMTGFILAFITALLNSGVLYSYYSSSTADTIRSYRLGEVISTAEREKHRVSISQIHEIEYYDINSLDAISLSESVNTVPSADIRLNSRGENIFFLRGAGERQLGLYLDGALLNVPWDNRYDLSMIPGDIIGKIRVVNGAGSVLFGANSSAGAVNITTIERSTQGFGGIARIQAGDGGSRLLSLSHDGKKGDFNYLANFSYGSSSGDILPSDFITNINQSENSSLRTNTAFERVSFFTRGEHHFGNTFIGASLGYVSGDKGVAPETHKGSNARFWKYPVHNRTMLILNAGNEFKGIGFFKATLWADIADVQIDSYKDFSYSEINESQQDDDHSFGGRLSFEMEINEWQSLVFSTYSIYSEHKETLAIEKNNSEYGQFLSSSGVEYLITADSLIIKAGLSYDFSQTIKAGPFTEAEGMHTDFIGILGGARYKFTKGISAFINTARKARFPTLRESFSAALGKFVINLGLETENAILTEAGFDIENDDFRLSFALFSNFYDGLIAKSSVPGEPGIETRVNLGNARISGIEISGFWRILNQLEISGFLTYMDSESKSDGAKGTLEYTPDFISFASINYGAGDFTFRLEGQFYGTQYGLNSLEGKMERICPQARSNFRLSYKLPSYGIYSDIYIRLNNIFDNYIIDKIGLPSAGRTLYSGISLNF